MSTGNANRLDVLHEPTDEELEEQELFLEECDELEGLHEPPLVWLDEDW